MPTIQNYEDTPDKFKVQSICLKRNVKVHGRNNNKYTIYVDMGEEAYTKKTNWKNEMQMEE